MTSPAGPDPAWIHRATSQELRRQIEALEVRAATHADRAAALRAMPLFGVPYAVKDNIDVQDWVTTAACPEYAHTAIAHAHVVARLADAGAICVGKTNLDQFATGLVGTRSPFGRPHSTFSAAHVSGGSSSGSAVVVCAARCPLRWAPTLRDRAGSLQDSITSSASSRPLGGLALAGVPFAVKNLFDVQGHITLAGSKIERNSAPAGQDALLVRRLEAARAVLVGTLNMDEYAYGFTTENSHAGATRNPYDLMSINWYVEAIEGSVPK